MKHKIIHMPQKSREKGFVLLLTMIIISVIMSISLSIFTITIKEIVLSTFLRESEKAFTAADRALECVLFWDRALPTQPGGLQYTPFPTSTEWTNNSINMSTVTCNTGALSGGDVRLDSLPGWVFSGMTATTGSTGPFTITFSDGTSAEITVQKNDINTVIISNGYNTSVTTNTRRTQRTIVARYNL